MKIARTNTLHDTDNELNHELGISFKGKSMCDCVRPDSCSRCRTPEEDDRYWDERRREMDSDDDY